MSSTSRSSRSPHVHTPFSRDRPGSSVRTPTVKFGQADRFYNPEIHDSTPGPIYLAKDLRHIVSPLYRQSVTETDDNLFHPSRDRSGWITGSTKNDLAHYTEIAQTLGPAHNPNLETVRNTAPKTKFSKTQRFLPLHILYMGKEVDKHGNISTVSPGPKYNPKLSQSELVSPKQPVYSFGGEGTSGDRSLFLSATVKAGCFYTGRPATAEKHVFAGPASYTPKAEQILNQAPRAKFTKDQRFQPLHIRYMGKKLDKHGNISTVSPGPGYYPKNHDLATKVLSKKFPQGLGNKGKWCP